MTRSLCLFASALSLLSGCSFFIPSHPQSNAEGADTLCIYTPATQIEDPLSEYLFYHGLKWTVEYVVDEIERQLIVESERYTNTVTGRSKVPLYRSRSETDDSVEVAVPFAQIEILQRIALDGTNPNEAMSCPSTRKIPNKEVGIVAVFLFETAEERLNDGATALKHRLRLSAVQVNRTKAKVPIIDPWRPWTYAIVDGGEPTIDVKITLELSSDGAPQDGSQAIIHKFDFLLTDLELPVAGSVMTIGMLDSGFQSQATDWFQFPPIEKLARFPNERHKGFDYLGELNIQATVVESNKFGDVVKKVLIKGQERKEEFVKKGTDGLAEVLNVEG